MLTDSQSMLTPAQRERFDQLDNDLKKRGLTRRDLAEMASPSPGGRFKQDHQQSADDYPRQPAGSPWGAGPQVGVEPPLGPGNNDMGSPVWLGEPIGSPAEVKRAADTLSARELGEVGATASPPGELVSADEGPTSQVGASPPPPFIPAEAHERLKAILGQRADGLPIPNPQGTTPSRVARRV